MDEVVFRSALRSKKVPLLVLDQKWHRLFAISGKPDYVKETEVELNELMARRAKLTQELKELQKIKASLMKEIVSNMEGAEIKNEESAASKKLAQDRQLIDDANERIEENEEELMEIPRLIRDKNEELMLCTMRFAYEKLRKNTEEAQEITAWIAQVRVELKKNIIRKQNRELNNREIYSYMHDIFGRDVVNLFDIRQGLDVILSSKETAGRTTEPEEGQEEQEQEAP